MYGFVKDNLGLYIDLFFIFYAILSFFYYTWLSFVKIDCRSFLHSF